MSRDRKNTARAGLIRDSGVSHLVQTITTQQRGYINYVNRTHASRYCVYTCDNSNCIVIDERCRLGRGANLS